jgi:fucose permease
MKRYAWLLLPVIYLTFIALGLPDALLGSAWNLVRVDLNTSLGMLGIMTVLIYSMSVFATFNAPRLLRSLETKVITFASVLFTGVALIFISRVDAYYQMLFFALPLGIGAGAIDVSLNHYLAANYKASHMNYLHSFYGIGVTVGPTIMAATLSQNSWRLGYVIIGGILLAIALVILLSFPLWKKEVKADREETHAHITIKAIFKTRGVVSSILIFLFYVHLESLGGQWIASYFYIQKALTYAEAALFTTAFYSALTLGRIASGVVSNRLSPKTLIRIGITLIVIAGFLLILDFANVYLLAGVVFLFGLGCAPIYPNMMFLNSLHFEKKQMSKIMSLQMAVGYLGFGLLTPLAGLIFDKTTIAIFPYFIFVVGAMIALIMIRYMRRTTHLVQTQ